VEIEERGLVMSRSMKWSVSLRLNLEAFSNNAFFTAHFEKLAFIKRMPASGDLFRIGETTITGKIENVLWSIDSKYDAQVQMLADAKSFYGMPRRDPEFSILVNSNIAVMLESDGWECVGVEYNDGMFLKLPSILQELPPKLVAIRESGYPK
jgi:hypothetical protein